MNKKVNTIILMVLLIYAIGALIVYWVRYAIIIIKYKKSKSKLEFDYYKELRENEWGEVCLLWPVFVVCCIPYGIVEFGCWVIRKILKLEK